MTVQILTGDCRTILAGLPEKSVHCCVTSPPYFGLRDYGIASQIGLEATPDAFVAELVAVFREVRRVLRDDATLWLNLGDSYVGGGNNRGNNSPISDKQGSNRGAVGQVGAVPIGPGLKPKDLIGIPWRVAFALQADGWYLRQDIIWAKPNPMPESVRDRCTKAHEYIFMLSKSARYHYDADAIAEPAIYAGLTNQDPSGYKDAKAFNGKHSDKQRGHGRRHDGFNDRWDKMEKAEQCSGMRNKRSVWTVATQPYSEAHFATFPPALIEPCIKAGTSERGCCPSCLAPWVREVEKGPEKEGIERGKHASAHRAIQGPQRSANGGLGTRVTTTTGWSPSCSCYPLRVEDAPACFVPKVIPCTVLDPFGGAGTTGLVADRLQRNAILIELNPAYAAMARARCDNDAPLFVEAVA